LKRLAQTVVDQHTASAAALRRLDERINARARVTSLARAEKRLGEGTAMLQGQVEALASKVDDIAARVVHHQPAGESTRDAELAELRAQVGALQQQVRAQQPQHQRVTLNAPAPEQTDVGAALLALAAALSPQKKPDQADIPTGFQLHDIRTWSYLVEENNGLHALETKLRLSLNIIGQDSRGAQAFALLWAWVEVVFEQGPVESITPKQLEFGERLLRDCRVIAAGARHAEVDKLLLKRDFGSDEVGRALATAKHGGSGDRIKCFKCGKMGHKGFECRSGAASTAGASSRSTSAGRRTPGTCWTCGEKGHKSPACPKKSGNGKGTQ
jgi:hypothetical protein